MQGNFILLYNRDARDSGHFSPTLRQGDLYRGSPDGNKGIQDWCANYHELPRNLSPQGPEIWDGSQIVTHGLDLRRNSLPVAIIAQAPGIFRIGFNALIVL